MAGVRALVAPCEVGSGKEASLSKDSLLYTKEGTGSSSPSVPATQLFSPCESDQSVPGPSSPREGQFLPLRVYNLAKLK